MDSTGWVDTSSSLASFHNSLDFKWTCGLIFLTGIISGWAKSAEEGSWTTSVSGWLAGLKDAEEHGSITGLEISWWLLCVPNC